jgi:hypothetical protein
MSSPSVVAFCPGPPLLLPAVGVGADEALLSLRAVCAGAVSALLASDIVVVLAAGEGEVLDESAGWSFAPWGVDVHVGGVAPGLSLPLAVGAWLLDEAGWAGPRRYVPVGLEVDVHPERWALLVIADGSTTRTEKAPGSFHPEAAAFDASVAAALASGKPGALAEIDADVGARVRAGGVSTWHAAADVLAGGTYDALLLADVAPYGVGYLVASWTSR